MAGRRVAIELLVPAGLAALLALMGPFGTFDTPLPSRVLTWELFMLGGTLCFRPVIGAARVLADHGVMPLPAGILCACVLATFPATVLVAWCLTGMGWRAVTLERLLPLYPEVLLIGVLATALQFAPPGRRRAAGDTRAANVDRPAQPPAAPQAVDAGPTLTPPPTRSPAPVPFLQRLPPALGRDLICLENEDHYVRAHTSRGSTLILMRLGDAVAELDGVDGLRTHRSWWVARDAVDQVVRRDRLVVLKLRNGVEAPVARTMVPVLRAAGWLSGSDGERIVAAPSPQA